MTLPVHGETKMKYSAKYLRLEQYECKMIHVITGSFMSFCMCWLAVITVILPGSGNHARQMKRASN
jgi:hypothetical protein